MECDIAGIRPSVSYYLQAFSPPVQAEGSSASKHGNLSSSWLRNPYHIPIPNFSPKLHISKLLATACGKALLLHPSKVDSDMEDLMAMNDDMTVVGAQANDATIETKEEDTATATKQPPMTPPQSERLSHQPRAQSLSVTVPKPQSHMRAQSIATSSPARKRLSLSFPVLPPGCEPPSRNRSPTSGTTTPQTPFPAEVDPDDSAAFLTALATQERRVLELREELSKAESELTKLKRQWAIHEAKKARREMAHGSSVLTSPTRRGDPRDSLASPVTREDFERRRRPTAGAGRKVLPSQRHTRTLSLLSPDRQQQQQPDIPTMDQDHSQLVKGHALMNSPSVKESSSSTSPLRTQSLDLPATRPKNQDVLLKTGKQMAEDFRDGLWNFIEDLKQATVGEDITRPLPIRRVPSRSNLRQPSTSTPTSLRSATKSKGKEREDDLIDLGQDEENQNFRWSTSTTLSDPPGVTTPPSRASTPRTSTRFVPSSFPQRWVALMLGKDGQAEEKIVENSSVTSLLTYTPSQIKKHATALMTQMEKTFEIEPVKDQKGGGTLGRSNSCSLKGEPGGELRSGARSPTQGTE